MKYYRQFLIVGGMPDCVSKFLPTKDYILVRHTQSMILASYLNDMCKYNNTNEIKKTRLVYDNITVQLSRKKTKFQYKLIKKGARAAEFENAIEWLNLSGIVTRIYRALNIKKPLEKSADNTKAKSLNVYMEIHKPEYAIKLSTKNFGFEDSKKTIPLYAAFCI